MGVLVASETGKKILRWLIIIGVIGGLLYAAFWIVMIIISIMHDQSSWAFKVLMVFGAIIIWPLIYYGEKLFNKIFASRKKYEREN